MKTKGWKNVFSFTFVQQVKSKSFIISTIIIAVIVAIIAATANVLPAVILGNEINKIESAANGESTFSISKLYILNETGIDLRPEEAFAPLGVSCENVADEAAAKAKMTELETSSENAMISCVTKEENSFRINSRFAGTNSNVGSNDAGVVSSTLSSLIKTRYYVDYLGIPEEELSYITNPVIEETSRAGEDPIGMVQMLLNTFIPMISSIVLFIFIFSYSQLVAQSVAIEKSSRIMEYLLTSIKPLAIIVGKVLAMCTVSLLQFMVIGMGGTLGFLISLPFGIFSKIDSLVAVSDQTGIASEAQDVLRDIQGAFASFNISSILIMLLTFVLGFLFFSLMAGLAGASISKMEDLSSAIQPMSFMGVIGFYLAYFPQISAAEGGDENIMMIVARFLPISSPFILSSDYMLGKISFGTAMLSILILAAAVVIMALLVAKVYEHIVLHTGNKLSLKDMLNMAK